MLARRLVALDALFGRIKNARPEGHLAVGATGTGGALGLHRAEDSITQRWSISRLGAE